MGAVDQARVPSVAGTHQQIRFDSIHSIFDSILIHWLACIEFITVIGSATDPLQVPYKVGESCNVRCTRKEEHSLLTWHIPQYVQVQCTGPNVVPKLVG
jgi:hypothetical protein